MENLSPYDILDLRSNASLAEIKTRFRILVLQFHPDKVDKTRTPWITEEYFNTIRGAYEQLCSMRRDEYCPSDNVNYQNENIANFMGNFDIDTFNKEFNTLHQPFREFTGEIYGYSEFGHSDSPRVKFDNLVYDTPNVEKIDIDLSLSNDITNIYNTYNQTSSNGLYGIVTLGQMDIATPSGLQGNDLSVAFEKLVIRESFDPNVTVEELYNNRHKTNSEAVYNMELESDKDSEIREYIRGVQKNDDNFNHTIASVRLIKNSI